LFPLDFYEKKSVPFSITFRSKISIPMVTSRGCSAQCVFCASRNYWGRMYRARSATNVLNEIEFLLDKFGFEEIQFIDDNLTFDKKRSKEIFRGIIYRRLKIHSNTPNGIAIWTLDEEMLELMKESGCYELTIAFESGVQEVVDKIIKKPINLKKAQVLVKKIKKMGIFVNAFFISGFPGETKQQILETFAFAERMDLDSAYFFAANPTPGSELYEICRKKGYLKDGFMFDEIEYNLPNIKTEEFSPRDVEKLILKQFNLFYMKQMIRHPVRFFNKFFNMFISHPVMSIRTFLADIKRIFIK
ncbi:MAG: radical SAM protein, partial [Candidatus Omnitrophica bacterium]|nr:radical SAM protein [Candidatus Omnitrophota bacterium]